MSAPRPASRNRLLRTLPAGLLPQLELGSRVALDLGETLCEAGDVMHNVYFPLDGFISMLVPVDKRPALELGLIGSEGMLGATDVLGVPTSPWRAVVQGRGNALRLSLAQFHALQRRSPGWQRQLRRYVHLQLLQQTRITACTHYHRLEARLARWLLMSLDRTEGDRLYFSHRFLADMLGVQRSAVTLAAGDLQRDGLINYVRGDIQILDRKSLSARACTCYQRLVDDDAAMFPPVHDAAERLNPCVAQPVRLLRAPADFGRAAGFLPTKHDR